MLICLLSKSLGFFVCLFVSFACKGINRMASFSVISSAPNGFHDKGDTDYDNGQYSYLALVLSRVLTKQSLT